MRGLLVVVLALALRPAAAQDDVLLPGGSSVFDGSIYEAFVGESFSQNLATCVEGIQTVLIPSFASETSTGLCRTPVGYMVFAAAAQSSLYGAGWDTLSTETRTPWRPDLAQRISIDRFEAPVDSAVAACILSAWPRALRTANMPRPDFDLSEISVDGEILYFAAFGRGRSETARAMNPRPGSLAGALAALGTSVGAVAQRRAPASVLGPACARLERLLPAEAP